MADIWTSLFQSSQGNKVCIKMEDTFHWKLYWFVDKTSLNIYVNQLSQGQ